MSKLNDIKGYFDISRNQSFNDEDMWEGQILLEDDGWFEGIVNDPNSHSYKGDRMIFGVYHPDKAIELVKFAPKDVSCPLIFEGKYDEKGYDGNFYRVGDYFGLGVISGDSRVIVQDAEYLKLINHVSVERRNIVSEKEKLLKRINKFKSNNEYLKLLYERTLEKREMKIKYVLEKYGFPIEETKLITESKESEQTKSTKKVLKNK